MEYLTCLQPLFKKYGKRQHPLKYENTYQLIIMVVLSAQTSDAMVNKSAPGLFKSFPSMRHLAAAKEEDLHPLIKSIRSYRKKTRWLVQIAKSIGTDENIPFDIDKLTELPGIGRKSANVIIREAGGTPQGIFLDLHVLRVVSRLGITKEEKPEKIERTLMKMIPQKHWHATGISLSYLGREICRPTEPICKECLLRKICKYNT